MHLGIGTSWKGEQISEVITGLKTKGFRISSGVSDGAKNLARGLKLSKIVQIEDCTHVFGNLLKNEYKNREDFKAFSKQCGQFKQCVMSGKDSLIMPPSQRVKGRFLNLKPLAQWGKNMLELLDQNDERLSPDQHQKLQWLTSYRALISGLFRQCEIMDQLNKILKTQGLSKTTLKRCEEVLSKQPVAPFFKEGVRRYLGRNLDKKDGKETHLCCSDIIESYFGKYKNQLAKMGNQIISASCLAIANFNLNFESTEMKEAMESTKIRDLIEWRKANLPVSTMQEKRNLFKKAA